MMVDNPLIHPLSFNSSPLKTRWLENDPFLVSVTFQGQTVKLREGKAFFPAKKASLRLEP